MCRCQQERKYAPRVGEVGQTQRECKPERAAERDCSARVGTCANHARGGEGRNEGRNAAGQKGAAVSAQRRVPWYRGERAMEETCSERGSRTECRGCGDRSGRVEP